MSATRCCTIVVLAVVCAGSWVAAVSARPTDARAEVERALRTSARTGRVPAGLTVAWSEDPGFWGAETFTLFGSGRLTRFGPGPTDAPEKRTVHVSRREVVGVVRLLVRLEAWRQRRTPHPDDARRAYLRIRTGSSGTLIWAWQDSNGNSPRLELVRARLRGLLFAQR